MSIIYGSPLFLSSSSQNADLPPLLDNFKAVTGEEENTILVSAEKIQESRTKELAGAVWVYGDHIPKNVNDGTKIQLTREEITRPDGEMYLTLNDVPASDAEIETIINIKESDGQLHPYIYLSNDYEGSGAGLLLRKDIYQKGQFHSSSHQYNGSIVDAWCEGTFLTTVLDTYVQEQLMSVNIQVQGAYISRKCFVLSIVEYNWSASGISEGNSLPYFKDNKARISLYQGSSADYYTRTYQSSNGNIWFVGLMGNAGPTPATTNLGYRPAICIKKSFKIKSTPNEDGSYDMYDDASTVSTFASSEFTVEKQVSWEQTKDFYARQFTYNSKKQYQTMLEGAVASVIVEGAPANVTDFQISGSGASPVLSWVNPIDDELYQETVVIQKQGSEPTDITDGTEIYRGTDETCTATGLEQSTDYYFAIYTVSSLGIYKRPVVKSYRFDFPDKPSDDDYTEISTVTTSGTFVVPENGWFKVVVTGKGFDGGTDTSPSECDYRVTAMSVRSGSGGKAGGAAVSIFQFNKGEEIPYTIAGNKATFKEMSCSGATASGGNLENHTGNNGTYGISQYINARTSKQSVSVRGGNGGTGPSKYNPYGGTGAGIYAAYDSDDVTFDSVCPTSPGKAQQNFIKFFRGNTNTPSPSQTFV